MSHVASLLPGACPLPTDPASEHANDIHRLYFVCYGLFASAVRRLKKTIKMGDAEGLTDRPDPAVPAPTPLAQGAALVKAGEALRTRLLLIRWGGATLDCGGQVDCSRLGSVALPVAFCAAAARAATVSLRLPRLPKSEPPRLRVSRWVG